MAQKTVLVFGGAGTIGSGAVNALLKRGARVVAVSGSEDRLKTLREKVGNPGDDKLITVVGRLTDEDASQTLRDAVLSKVDHITDVIASIGSWWQKGPVLDQTLAEFRAVCDNILTAQFLAAKYFLPLIADKEGSSYTLVTGMGGVEYNIPNSGFTSIFGGAYSMMIQVMIQEWKEKPVRINQFRIQVFVNDTMPNAVKSHEMGEVLSSVVFLPAATGKVLDINNSTMAEVAKNGITS